VAVVTAWAPLLIAALDFAIQQAKSLGLPPPVADEIDKIKAAVNERLDSVLPLAIVGVAASAVAVAAKAQHEIESLGTSPHCAKCGAVAYQTIEKQVGKTGTVALWCPCGWTLP